MLTDWIQDDGYKQEGDRVVLKQYDKICLKSGETAYIVEIFGDGECILADIDRLDGTETDWLTPDEIEKVLD